jgi:hypothetical protein
LLRGPRDRNVEIAGIADIAVIGKKIWLSSLRADKTKVLQV